MRSVLLAAALCLAGAPSVPGCMAAVEVPTPAASALDARARALAAALWAAQDADGAWRSRRYAVMAGGYALTPVVLGALERLGVPGPAGARERGLERLRALAEHGQPADGAPREYPTYADAYALACLVRVRDPADVALRERIAKRLLAAQCAEATGFAPDHPAYGGWGFSAPPAAGQPGHVDLAHTRIVLQALRAADALDAAAAARARRFVALVQRDPSDARTAALLAAHGAAGAQAYDGGCILSPIVIPANKGATWWTSYATASCDGLLALRAIGNEGDPGVRALEGWLAAHPRWDWPEGIPASSSEPWGESVRFYHLAVRAEATLRLDASDLTALTATLGEPQPDGLHANPGGFLMKEDDPLVASALAAIALAAAAGR